MDNAAVAVQRATQLQFIKQTLLPRILATDAELSSSKLIESEAALQDQLDGFMSAIYNLNITTSTTVDGTDKHCTKHHRIIVKLMKGDVNFRTGSKSYLQFANEVYIYARVLPRFQRLLEASVSSVRIESWVPKMYYGFFGAVSELSALDESILAVQDLRPQHFRSGPHLLLDETHLRLTIKMIAQFHALSYALRLRYPDEYRELVAGLLPFSFVPTGTDGDTANLYTVMYDIAVKRFMQYMRRTEDRRSSRLRSDVANMYRQYGQNPVQLLEHLRRPDEPFTAILHGDYNRNNVLFRYADADGHDSPIDMRMIDFQETRFASPALDLAFMLYMNSDLHGCTAAIWDQLLQHYHETMLHTLASVTGLASDDARLQPFSYARFLDHFSQFAFYGVLVCIHFTPWKVCPTADCDRLSKLFESDMYGVEFRDLSMVVGGADANERICGIVEHASARGYMRIFEATPDKR